MPKRIGAWIVAVVIARVDDDDGSGTATNPAWDLPDF